ncbi:MAG: TTC39/IML2 family protein [Melioribacter sp.]|nr:TTC39/IML2 family protein [Melioribacter sp.]
MRKSLIILLLVLPVTILSQNLFTQLSYADSLFKNKNYFDAITEYKRLMFFDNSKSFSFITNFNIAKCYKAGGKYEEAIKYFSKAELSTDNSAQKYRAKIEIVKVNLLRKTTDRALQILNEIERTEEFNQLKDSINYWKGWVYIFKDEWKLAKSYFDKVEKGHTLSKISSNVLKEKYSVTFAKLISYIVPGSGQFYTGNILSGLMSMAYNMIFGYLTVKAFSEDRFFDGALIGSLLWLRFYRGNIQNAEKFAIEKNIAISNNALKFLQYEYKGDKP